MTRPVTVDTGGSDDVFPGCLLTWLHTPRGGYGYTMPVDAKCVAYARSPGTWVRIEVKKTTGELVTRRVQPANLRWRST